MVRPPRVSLRGIGRQQMACWLRWVTLCALLQTRCRSCTSGDRTSRGEQMTRRRQTAALAGIVAAVVLVVAACSGSDPEGGRSRVTGDAPPHTGGASTTPTTPDASDTSAPTGTPPRSSAPVTTSTSTSAPVSVTMVMNGDLLLHNTLWDSAHRSTRSAPAAATWTSARCSATSDRWSVRRSRHLSPGDPPRPTRRPVLVVPGVLRARRDRAGDQVDGLRRVHDGVQPQPRRGVRRDRPDPARLRSSRNRSTRAR